MGNRASRQHRQRPQQESVTVVVHTHILEEPQIRESRNSASNSRWRHSSDEDDIPISSRDIPSHAHSNRPPSVDSLESGNQNAEPSSSSNQTQDIIFNNILIPPLPPGWQSTNMRCFYFLAFRDGKRRIYFVDHNTKRTVWEHPITGINYNLPPDQWFSSHTNQSRAHPSSSNPNKISFSLSTNSKISKKARSA